MSLAPITGNTDLRDMLASSVASGRLPQSLLLHGPRGVGKQRLALWLASLIQCENTEPPCGQCRPCRMNGNLQHPDLHWFFPVPRPKGTSAAKMREKLEEARLAELVARAKAPLAARPVDQSAGIFLPIVEEIRARATRRPAMGDTSVYIVGDAERMVPQAANPEAANALLKLLEEPPPDTFVILTSSRPGALLPTIRSRLMAVRVPPLAEREVAEFLVREAAVPEQAATRVARLASGSIGAALAGEAADGRETRKKAEAMVRSAARGTSGDRLMIASTLPPSGARGPFMNLLDAVSVVLRDGLTVTTGSAAAATDSDVSARTLGSDPVANTPGLLTALEAVDSARDAALANGNPQAIAAVLLQRMAVALAQQPVS